MKTDKKCACGGGIIGTVLGIIFGIIVASLFAAGSTPLIVTAIWIAFAIAGAIGSISSRLGDLYLTTIKKKDKLDGSTEIKFEKKVPNIQNNQN